MNPLVTVLIPVYNRPSVVNTINSIINQTYKNIEILVIDNASTDNTVECVKKLNDQRIRLIINEKNLGQTGSMNRGLDLAFGKYIARIDSDDVALPDRIELQVNFLESNPEYVLVGSWIRYISDDNQLGGIVKTCGTDEGLRFMQTFFCGIHHPTAMYRTSIIRTYSIKYDPNITMAEDYDMWRKLLHYGKGLNLNKVLIYYRRGKNNDSIIHLNEMIKESRSVRRMVCDELELSLKEKKKMNNLFIILEKESKSIFDTIKYLKIMFYFLNKYLNKENKDYKLVVRYIIQTTYGECVRYSKNIYYIPIKKIYNCLQSRMH